MSADVFKELLMTQKTGNNSAISTPIIRSSTNRRTSFLLPEDAPPCGVAANYGTSGENRRPVPQINQLPSSDTTTRMIDNALE